MDLSLLLEESLLVKDQPVQHNQFVNFHGVPHMISLEVENGFLKIKKIKKVHQKKNFLQQNMRGKIVQFAASRLQQFRRSKTIQGRLTVNNSDDTENDEFFCLKATLGTQTDPSCLFTTWTQVDETITCGNATQTEPIDMHSDSTQTTTISNETRSNQTEPEVFTRSNQTDNESCDKSEQTDWICSHLYDKLAAVGPNALHNNELLLLMVQQILQLTQDRNFQVNLRNIKQAMQLPEMLQQLENYGLKAYLEQRRNALGKFRLWHKHNHYINLLKRQRSGSATSLRKQQQQQLLEEITKERIDDESEQKAIVSTSSVCTQTISIEQASVGCQSAEKRRKWSLFSYNQSSKLK